MTKQNLDIESVKKNEVAYDETPYHSYPYAQSAPEKIATLATLFGMNPAKIENARVLELGCAEGGNIIPHAIHYPKGEYVGIDLSKVQIDAGKKHIESMGLKNIELKHASITDIDESYGKFDYIICHGVFSWVPEFVREKILEISSKNLSENGVVYISYNTLPGWNMVRTIRDMMMYHAKGFDDPANKVAQARALLAFVKESLEGTDTPYAKMLAQEADLLSKQGDHYIRHEHLEDQNYQFYFSDFIAQANSQGLQYLSDCSLASMYLGNMKPSIVEKLKELNDIVRTEQYMDFITNRRFRSSLLCHSSVKLNRALNNEDAKRFSLSLDITAEKAEKDIDLENTNENLKFFFKNNKEQHISTTSPWLKSVLYVFAENKGYPLSYDSIVKQANEKFKEDRKAQIENDLLNNAMNLVIKGYMDICLLERNKAKVNLDKPCVSNLVLHQVNNTVNNWVTSPSHVPIGINIFDKFALKYMDGKNTKDSIIEHLTKEVESGNLTVNQDNKKVEGADKIKEMLTLYLDDCIARLSSQGVFV